MWIKTIFYTLSMIALLCTVQSATTQPVSPEVEIRHLMHGMFDRPQAPLKVEPIVVAGDYALAGWAQAGKGGRALLRRKSESWTIILCAGDAIRAPHALMQAGLPARIAEELARLLADAESRLAPDRLALFSTFDGVVMIDEKAAHHPPHGHQTQPSDGRGEK